MNCVLTPEAAIYCSSELTSGLRQYKEMQKHGVKSAVDLKRKRGEDWVQKNIVDVNIQEADLFAASVRHAQSDGTQVINPAPLKVPDWGQPEYLAFWEELIRSRVKEVRFNKNWQFSNGCTFEFVVATDAKVRTLDADGNLLGPRTAVEQMEAAIERFRDLDTKKLKEHLKQVQLLASRASTN